MKKNFSQRFLHQIRSATPLFLRQKIGPMIAFLVYFFSNKSNRPHVLSINDTLDHIIKKELSVVRFGDGEITLLDDQDLSFQQQDLLLSKRLELIFRSNNEKLLLCIPGIWGDLDVFEKYAKKFIVHHLYRQAHIWNSLLSKKVTYGDAYITRHYLAFRDKASAGATFKKFFSIWNNKDVVLIEGFQSRVGVGNDIFSNTNSVKRILCPAENAFSKYDQILNEAKKISKDKLILVALGPTAKVLAYDLFILGYRVIDIGHIDMEYDMFIRKHTTQIKVPYKYFNEINERNPEDCNDKVYLSQITATII